MPNQQIFLMDSKKTGRVARVEIYNVTRTQKREKARLTPLAFTPKVTKKNYLITVYNRVFVDEVTTHENGTQTVAKKEKFVKWSDFEFQEVVHPKDKIKQFFTKIEMALDYISDTDLTNELVRRGLVPLTQLSDELLENEVKRRGLTEFINILRISPNATFGQRLRAKLEKSPKIKDTTLSFEETLMEIKKRHLLTPKDLFTDEELLKECTVRNLNQKQEPTPVAAEKPKKKSFFSRFKKENAVKEPEISSPLMIESLPEDLFEPLEVGSPEIIDPAELLKPTKSPLIDSE